MRRVLPYLIIVALSILSCGKDPFGEGTISFSAEDGGTTRAMMNDAALKTNGNKLRICDVLTGFSGRVSWMGEGNPYYINDSLVYAGTPIWNYGSGRTYPWTADGTHKFFSWLRYDQALNMYEADFCGASYNDATQILTIPQKEMNVTTPQFDFMYSDVIKVPAATHTAGSPINLELHHLFSALNITLLNTSGNTVILKSVVLRGIKNSRSATVDFSGDAVRVDTDNATSVEVPLFVSENADTEDYGDTFVSEDVIKNLAPFYLMWPQTYEDLVNAELYVTYKALGINNQLSSELHSTIRLGDQTVFKTDFLGMDAGSRYSFMLMFQQSALQITMTVLPWEYETFDWDYSNHSISARSGMNRDGVLVFYRYDAAADSFKVQPTANEWSAKTMQIDRGEVMQGRFYIEAPTSGLWQVTPYPASAAQYFIVEPTTGDIDAYTNNGEVAFTVRPNPDNIPASAQTLFFNVAIYFNGEWHDANSEFNRKNIRLLLNAN